MFNLFYIYFLKYLYQNLFYNYFNIWNSFFPLLLGFLYWEEIYSSFSCCTGIHKSGWNSFFCFLFFLPFHRFSTRFPWRLLFTHPISSCQWASCDVMAWPVTLVRASFSGYAGFISLSFGVNGFCSFSKCRPLGRTRGTLARFQLKSMSRTEPQRTHPATSTSQPDKPSLIYRNQHPSR